MRFPLLALFILCCLPVATWAQTDPTPFDLSLGNFTFTEWPSDAEAGTAPQHMAFHFTENPSGSMYDLAANGTGDWDCSYDLTNRNRFMGHGADGIAMRATGNPQRNDCTDGDADPDRYVGAVVLALNTLNRKDITVNWTGGTVTVGNGDPDPRVFALRMQFRVGTEAFWTDIAGPVEYVSDTEGASQEFSVGLPSISENRAVVQVRWLYYQHVPGSGTRPELRLDDVTVSSDSLTTGVVHVNRTNMLRAFPNPSETGVFQLSSEVTGTVFNILGSPVKQVSSSAHIDLSSKPQGVYLLRTDSGMVLRLNR